MPISAHQLHGGAYLKSRRFGLPAMLVHLPAPECSLGQEDDELVPLQVKRLGSDSIGLKIAQKFPKKLLKHQKWSKHGPKSQPKKIAQMLLCY